MSEKKDVHLNDATIEQAKASFAYVKSLAVANTLVESWFIDCAGPPQQYVTLDQIAAISPRKKRTFEGYKTKGEFPPPDIEGGGGKPDEWLWSKVRPWLQNKFGRDFPERFPSVR